MSIKIPVVLVLSAFMLVPRSSAQITGFPNLGNIGPSKAEVIGAAIGAGAVIGLVVYLVVPKQATIEGCMESANGVNRISGNDSHNYEVVAAAQTLPTGHVLKLKGKKHKDKSGNRQFTVKRVVADKGPC